MARTLRNAKLDSPSARAKLKLRREPYWVVISKGCALGYGKRKTGTWIARYRDDTGKQRYHALGAADDTLAADDGDTALSYAEAQRKAVAWFKLAARGFEDEARPRNNRYTVRDALTDYMAAYERRGGKAADRMWHAINGAVLPVLGDISVAKLTRHRIEQWLDGLAKSPARLRSKPGAAPKFRMVTDAADGLRRRRSTANRTLTVLKAALNHAYHDRRITDDAAWRSVKPFRQADAARVHYLDDAEARRLVNACSVDFRPLVQAALLTGCRYGELTALKVADYSRDAGTILIRQSKSGKPRHVVLTDEGRQFFDAATAGKAGTALALTKRGGSRWGNSHQQRPFKTACEHAKLPPLTFHELRHTYASRLVMHGAPLAVVAAQLGHSDTRMVEKYYGHLAPSYVADTIRATFDSMGVVAESNVMPIKL